MSWSIIEYLVAGILSVFWIYLVFRVASAAIVKSLERRKEKQNGKTK